MRRVKHFDVTIRRHGVLPADRNPFAGVPAATGFRLTDFQADLLEHTKPIRICSAPTGAGKTFAFEWAPALDLNILFIVPTKRLAQNLEKNVRATMSDGLGWSDTRIARSLAVWSSDDVAEKERAGMSRTQIRQQRVGQLRGQNFSEKGTFIIATPESVAWLLLSPPPPTHGQAGMAIVDLLGRHHIVFDEFHTIEDQGFGLAAALCKVTSGLADAGEFGVRPKITFLSATPVEIAPVLEAFEVPSTEVVHLEEGVWSWDAGDEPEGARIMHGDVAVSLNHHENIAEACRAEEAAIREALARHESVICVFDSLARIKADRDEIAKIFTEYGVPHEKIMTINSIDDRHDLGSDEHGVWGRGLDPSEAQVILATSSIEMGVTFSASLMIMDPGFSEASFIQRAGRVSRKDTPGRVIVVKGSNHNISTNLPKGQAELEKLDGDGSRVSVDLFTRWALRCRIAAFRDTDLLSDRITFSSMPMRAVWCAAVFWVAMDRSWTARKGEWDTLSAHAPAKAKAVGCWVKRIEASECREPQEWVRRFIEKARELRGIESRVRVRYSGQDDLIPVSMAGRYSEIAKATVGEDSDGHYLILSRPLSSIMRSKDTRRYEASLTPFPLFAHAQVGKLPQRSASGDWVRETKRLLQANRMSEEEEAIFEIASRLVGLTSLVPCVNDCEVEDAGDGSGLI